MKRKKGDGSIRQRDVNDWEARITVNGRQKSFYGKTEKEVTKKLNEFKKKISQGLSDSKRMSYEDFLINWLEIKKSQIKPQSYDRIESTVNLHIIPTIGYFDLDKIDADIIKEEIIDKMVHSFSFSTVKKVYDALNESFRYAQDKGKIVHNPVNLVKLPTSTSGQYKKKSTVSGSANNLEIFTDDEIKKFLLAAGALFSNDIPVYRNANIFLFMLNTGVRMCEASAVKWKDYNEEEKTIRIFSSIVYAKDNNRKRILIDQESTKTKGSERILKLNLKALEALPTKRIGEYIFCTKEGRPLRPGSIQNTLDCILTRAGIPHKSTHVFRHTFASKLFEKKIDVKIISEILGHSDVRTTYNTYITLIKQQKAQAMKAIEVY